MAGIDLSYAFRLPPEKAIAYFRAKGYAFSWDWHDLWQEAHAKAFTVAKALRMDVLEDIRDAVDRALNEGQTLAEFRRDLEPRLKAKGWWGKVTVGDGEGGARQVQLGSPWRLKTIYRTNLQTAYMAGRWQAFMENVDDRPYLQYVAVLDSRTRPTHRALHGKVFRYDDPFWRDLYPPNGWGCRCRVRALSSDDIAARGLRVEQSGKRLSTEEALVSKQTGELRQVAAYRFRDPVTGKPLTMRPDVGWSYNPGMAWQEPFVPRQVEGSLPEAGRVVGAAFHPKTPIDKLPAKPIGKDMLLPRHQESGWSEEEYINVFLAEFGTSFGQRPVVFRDVVGDPLVVSAELFRDRKDGGYKVKRADREIYLKLLADTIKDPTEVWVTWVKKGGRVRLCRRYIGLYRGDKKRLGGYVVFDLVDDTWQGTTTFKPRNLRYLDQQRTGTLLYTKK